MLWNYSKKIFEILIRFKVIRLGSFSDAVSNSTGLGVRIVLIITQL